MNDSPFTIPEKNARLLADTLLEYAPKGWQTLFLRYECTAESDIIKTWAVINGASPAPIKLTEEDKDRIRDIANFSLPFDEDACCDAFQMVIHSYEEIFIEYYKN